jgi:hypothetical protein
MLQLPALLEALDDNTHIRYMRGGDFKMGTMDTNRNVKVTVAGTSGTGITAWIFINQ